MSRIGLARLAPGDAARVAHLRRGPGQEDFTSDPVSRMAVLGAAEDAFAILDGAAVVGFFVLDRGFAAAHDFAAAGDIGLRALLIDAGAQGRGLGRAMLAALPAVLRADYPDMRRIVLTVNLRNTAAIAAYRRAGFQQDEALYLGGRSGPQYVLWLEI